MSECHKERNDATNDKRKSKLNYNDMFVFPCQSRSDQSAIIRAKLAEKSCVRAHDRNALMKKAYQIYHVVTDQRKASLNILNVNE